MADVYVRCKDTQSIPQPVADVLVRIFSEDGSTFITEQTTGVTGLAEFALAPATYRAKLSRAVPGYSVVSPQLLVVSADGDVFDVSVTLHTRPTSSDPNLCRISGYITKPDGTGASGVVLIFEPIGIPRLYATPSLLMAPQKVSVITDANGYAVVDLYRMATYSVTLAGFEYAPACVTVPDAASSNLPDLLFPYPLAVTFTPSSVALAVGEPVDVGVTVTMRSGLIIPYSELDVETCVLGFTSTSDFIAITASTDGLRLQARQNGSYTVTPIVYACTTFVYPEVTISGSLPIVCS